MTLRFPDARNDGLESHLILRFRLCTFSADVVGYGPITQGNFLMAMGIQTRMQMMLQALVKQGRPEQQVLQEEGENEEEENLVGNTTKLLFGFIASVFVFV